MALRQAENIASLPPTLLVLAFANRSGFILIGFVLHRQLSSCDSIYKAYEQQMPYLL